MQSPEAQSRSAESSSSTERFTLTGPSPGLDPRYNAYRGDLADAALASKLFAPHYARAVVRRIGSSEALLYEKADEGSAILSPLQAGEEYALLDITGTWAWGYRMSDHLVGYVHSAALLALDD